MASYYSFSSDVMSSATNVCIYPSPLPLAEFDWSAVNLMWICNDNMCSDRRHLLWAGFEASGLNSMWSCNSLCPSSLKDPQIGKDTLHPEILLMVGVIHWNKVAWVLATRTHLLLNDQIAYSSTREREKICLGLWTGTKRHPLHPTKFSERQLLTNSHWLWLTTDNFFKIH